MYSFMPILLFFVVFATMATPMEEGQPCTSTKERPGNYRPELGAHIYGSHRLVDDHCIAQLQRIREAERLRAVLDECQDGMGYLIEQDSRLYKLGLAEVTEKEGKRKKSRGEDTPIINLEHVILKLAAGLNQHLCKGVLYVLVLPPDDEGDIFVRYLETGMYVGWMEEYGMSMLAAFCEVPVGKIYKLPVFTQQDVKTFASRRDDSTKTDPKRVYDRLLRQNQQSVIKILERMVVNITDPQVHLFVHAARQKGKTEGDDRFIYTTPGMDPLRNKIEESLSCQLVLGSHSSPINTLLTQIGDMQFSDLAQQIQLLGSISNYHWWPYLDSSGRTVVSDARSYSSFLLWHPNQEEGMFIPTEFVPSSLRNQVVYFTYHCDTFSHRLSLTLQHALRQDLGGQNVLLIDREVTDCVPSGKRRKVTSRIVPQAEDLASVLGLGLDEPELAEVENKAEERSLFRQFQDELISDSMMIWREHSADSDTVVMNDYCPSTGRMLPQKFVHVRSEGGNTYCTCKTFLLNELAARKKLQPDMTEAPQVLDDIALEERVSCMHCRFFKENLEDLSPKVVQDEDQIPHFLRAISENLDKVGKSVVFLGSHGSTSKFSVKGSVDDGGLEDKDKFCIVHMTIYQGDCWSKCMSGSCQVSGTRNKKKFPKVGILKKDSNVCSHLRGVIENFDTVKSEMDFFSPEYVDRGELADVDNEDEVEKLPKVKDVTFNIETGLWEAKAISVTACSNMNDDKLVEKTGNRLRYVVKERMRGGMYEGPELVPDGDTCNCAGKLEKVYKYSMKVYTRVGVLHCPVYHLQCSSSNLCPEVDYTGEEDRIFSRTRGSGVGEELCWDFVQASMTTKVSFTGFCKELSRRYTTTSKQSVEFVCPATFQRMFLTWICKMNIDFREHIDPWCGYDPQKLACDGTHLGVSAKQMHLEKAVSTADVDQIKPSVHRRADRLFIQDNVARDFLMFLARKTLKDEVPDQDVHMQNLGAKVGSVIDCYTSYNKAGITAMMAKFMRKDAHTDILHPVAKLLKLLCASNKCALTSVFPFRYHQDLRELCQAFDQGQGTGVALNRVTKYLPQAGDILKGCERHNSTSLGTDFLRDMIEITEAIHANDLFTDPPQPQPGTYNPTSGTAYYFHQHGCQVRNMPKYDPGDEVASDKDSCRKIYPKISLGGFGYMFLYFCPEHGHCYGFHLVSGGEGRKDPFSPIYKFKATPPTDIFYDNACQFSEYSLNREPEFWKLVRFWHDLFHGYNHVCGKVYRSTRVEGMAGLNSEICEQFNAYIQCIKYTSCKMTQDHFMLYMQFMIYLWNNNKTEYFRKMYQVALRGRL